MPTEPRGEPQPSPSPMTHTQMPSPSRSWCCSCLALEKQHPRVLSQPAQQDMLPCTSPSSTRGSALAKPTGWGFREPLSIRGDSTMSQPGRSRALVIVNTHFGDGDGALGTRRGAKREAERLSKVLARLNYKVKLMHNKTAKEIEDLYQQECHQEHGEYFVSIVSSHGEEGVILGCDSEPVELIHIFQILSSEKCPVLRKIPKIFFIQACRGRELDRGVVVECDSREPKPNCLSSYLSIPPQTVVMFACSPGYVAFLNIFGSMFLQALLKVLEGEERHLALNRLMTRVSWQVAFGCEARGTYEGCKEMPCFVTNLLQEVFPFSMPITEEAEGV